MDQRRQIRRALDPPVLSQLRGQPGSPATARPGLQPRQLPQAIGPAASREALDSHNATRQAGQDRLQDRVPRSICDVPVGGSRGAGSPVPSDSGSDSTVRRYLAEGCTNMTGRGRTQPDKGGRGAAGTVTNPGTNRLSGHSECRFCFHSPSVVRQSSILNLHSPGERWHNGRLGSWCRCWAKLIWKMSDERKTRPVPPRSREAVKTDRSRHTPPVVRSGCVGRGSPSVFNRHQGR